MLYLPHTNEDIASMLQVVGVDDLDGLFSTVPEDCRCKDDLNLPQALNEWELNNHMAALSHSMAVSPEYRVFVGAGSYEHFIPASVSYLLGRSEFVTSYTPYQPEMSQGTLQAIYEYQTLASRLLGMEIATASHYDGATALAHPQDGFHLIRFKGEEDTLVLDARAAEQADQEISEQYSVPETEYLEAEATP